MNEIVIFEGASGQIDVRLEKDNVWLSQAQLAQLFSRDRSVIGRHVTAIFSEGELDDSSNVQKMHIPPADKPTTFYSLDVIISVGYRVKSREGIRFRQWASRILKDYLTRGYALDRQRLEHNARELEAALQLVRRMLAAPDSARGAGRGLAEIVVRYTQAFLFAGFLHRNGRLFGADGNPVVNDVGLAALSLLVAQSRPDEKAVLIRLIMNMLAGEVA